MLRRYGTHELETEVREWGYQDVEISNRGFLLCDAVCFYTSLHAVTTKKTMTWDGSYDFQFFIAEIKNEWSCISTPPHLFMVWYLVTHILLIVSFVLILNHLIVMSCSYALI
jgi:hypothetical protein